MYCLQWLIPVLLIPKPVHPALLYNHLALLGLYLTGFFLERKPCTICTLIFLIALGLIFYSADGGDEGDEILDQGFAALGCQTYAENAVDVGA